MREILFRGKTFDGDWEEGSLHIEYGETTSDGKRTLDYRILGMRGECRYVDPNTVGQYTGLCDKNGIKIFEGDILEFPPGTRHPVFFDADYCGFGSCYFSDFDSLYKYNFRNIAVIGNIHDNPEFLGGTE